MIVCVCRRVTDRQIRQAVAEGAESLESLQFELGVAMQCGRCADCASRLLCDARRAAAPEAANANLFPIAVVRSSALRSA